MELIVISESKLKITLTPPDMEKYALETEEMSCVDPRTREAIRHIFRDARTEIGFDTEGARLFVQLYASRGGGCEIFVTKLEEPSEEPRNAGECHDPSSLAQDSAPSQEASLEGERRLLSCLRRGEGEPSSRGGASSRETPTSKGVPALAGRSEDEEQPRDSGLTANAGEDGLLLALPSLEALLSLCHRLAAVRFIGESTAYITEGDPSERWYLLLRWQAGADRAHDLTPAVLSEYGERETGDRIAYLTEHSRTVVKGDAVEVLGRLG